MPDPSMFQAVQSRPRLRALAHTAVVVAAAIGSIATSPLRWHVAASPVAKPSSGKGQLLTIEASAVPTVTTGNGPITRRLRPEGIARPWIGRANYFVPPTEVLTSVEIEGVCGGGCSKCEPPPGAFARVASVVEVVPWTIDASAKPTNLELNGPSDMPSYRIVVEATRPPALVITPAPKDTGFYLFEMPDNPYVDPKDDPKAPTKRYAFSIKWSKASQSGAAPISATWTPTASIYGYCTEPGPCVAPNSERVTILSVEGPPGSGAASSTPASVAAPVGSAGP